MKPLVVVVALAACSGGGGTDASSGDTFIAFSSSFDPFRSWTHFHSDGPVDDGTFPPNVLGMREQYISTPPPSGSSEFPIGTMIVEVRASDGKIFAGAKRGGDFNSGGAKNWEFFELTENPVTIFWRGLGPPLGDTYGGDPNGCNTCHITCGSNNDYVCSAQLQLSSF